MKAFWRAGILATFFVSDLLGVQVRIAVQGRVVLDDGSPAQGVSVGAVCGGADSTSITDKDGRFMVGSGVPEGIPAEATPSLGAMGGGCSIRFSLPGFQPYTYQPAAREGDVLITLHPAGPPTSPTISITTAAAPEGATRLFRKGLRDEEKRHIPQAMAAFKKAVAIYPHFAAAWFEMAKLEASSDAGDAQIHLDAAVNADPKFINSYLLRSDLAFRARDWQRLADSTAHALKLSPAGYPRQWFYDGVAQFELAHFDAAETSWRTAEKLDTAHEIPLVHEYLAAVLARRKDFAGAADEARQYLATAPHAPDAANVRARLAQYEQAEARK